MKLNDIANSVKTKEDFLKFITALRNDLEKNPNEWENDNLKNYLEAIQAWVNDMDGYYKNNKIEIPTSNPWKLFTDILIAAKVYE